MGDNNNFKGVVCHCINGESKYSTIVELLDLTTTSTQCNVRCNDLKLSNKYYNTTVHLFDYAQLDLESDITPILNNCHAVIIFGDGRLLTEEQLEQTCEKLTEVRGEPRVLLCHGIDEECNSYKTLQDWCIRNSYELLLTSEEDVKDQLIDSLSAYRWVDTLNNVGGDHPNELKGTENGGESSRGKHANLDEGLMKKMVDFDHLLHKLSVYRDNPDARGNPDDKNIEEIAELLSGLLGDENDNFLDEEDADPSIP